MSAAQATWLDRAIAWLAPKAGIARLRDRRIVAAMPGYESAQPGRKRRFHLNTQSGDALARVSAAALRNQARHLERNHDIVRGALDKLVDFTVGAGVTIEPQPKRLDGSIHREFAQVLARRWAEWSEWPEVTWTHDWGAAQRLAARTWFRDGEVLGQLVLGPRQDNAYGSAIPVALELLESDVLPHDFEDAARNIRQGIERNGWGRPVGYHVFRQHPGDDRLPVSTDLKRIPAENMLHLRMVDRIGQLRGVSILASVIARLQDLHEYEDAERQAAKMAASLVLKLTHGTAEMWKDDTKVDPSNPPVYQMDSGMIVVNTAPGEDAAFFDSKRPNAAAEPFSEMQLRRCAAGLGLSYSALARNYNGTYSAQRQELVENWPHYHALTGVFVAQWVRPVWQPFVRFVAAMEGLPRNLDRSTLADALFLGPPMPWIDPLKEAQAQVLLVQAAFKSSAAVIRERGGALDDTYRQLAHERAMRKELGIGSAVEGAPVAVSPAKPDSTDADAPLEPGKVVDLRRFRARDDGEGGST